MNIEERTAELERAIAELESRLPKHSVPADMIMELEELEEQLEALKRESPSEKKR